MNAAAIPLELREQPRWVVWCWGDVDPKTGKRKKPPYCPHNLRRHASSTKETTWGTFEQAVTLVEAGKADGIGLALAEELGVVFLDLDDELSEADQDAIVLALNSYTERSPSGTGQHVLVRAALNGHGLHPTGFGVFAKDRFCYFTGEHVRGTPTTIEERQAQLKTVLEHFLPKPERPKSHDATLVPVDLDDRELLDRMFDARNGAAVRTLYEGRWEHRYSSQSEADLALCSSLAFWTGNDPDRIDRMFRERPRARQVDRARGLPQGDDREGARRGRLPPRDLAPRPRPDLAPK